MRERWSEAEAGRFEERYAADWGRELAQRTLTSRLLGAEPGLVLHGGGNTSLKGVARNLLGEEVATLRVKASGHDLATLEPAGHVAVDLAGLRGWVRSGGSNGATHGAEEERILRSLLLDPNDPTPSIEAPVHAVIPGKFVDHSHADAVLALTNRPDGEAVVRQALGAEVVVLPYVPPGIELARAVAEAVEANPAATAMVWMFHGVVTWGETARESYQRMIELVSRAEEFLRSSRVAPTVEGDEAALAQARRHWSLLAPVVRGLLASESGDPDQPWRRVVLGVIQDETILPLLAAEGARELLCSPALTADHLIRTRPLPLWLGDAALDDPALFRSQLKGALAAYGEEYDRYVERHRDRLAGLTPFAPQPRVLLIPGLGAVVAGDEGREAALVRDITAQTLTAKAQLAASGARYQGLAEEHLFDMEYRPQQHAKLRRRRSLPLAGRVALITGAAGAIGSGIAHGLLEAGAQVAVTDLAGPRLDSLAQELGEHFADRVIPVGLDVTDPAAVGAAFQAVNRQWGGVDLVVINAGLAHVASLAELEPADFQRLTRVNVDGTLFLLKEAARHFRLQATGGDVVLISTKNVFAPGARFGAYSATKAAAHQLARIASLEMASLDVRVNMVAPDAVFGEGERRSGLWAEVGPDRMRARGLSPQELEEYYRQRNLLAARITPRHVANAVLFFATRQTPTTGATLPVDGGLPDATPR